MKIVRATELHLSQILNAHYPDEIDGHLCFFPGSFFFVFLQTCGNLQKPLPANPQVPANAGFAGCGHSSLTPQTPHVSLEHAGLREGMRAADEGFCKLYKEALPEDSTGYRSMMRPRSTRATEGGAGLASDELREAARNPCGRYARTPCPPWLKKKNL